MEERMSRACEVLRRLGVTANYKGFSYTAYAAALCAERPDLLQMVTKDLYPAVARQYRTSWQAVERNIRTVIDVAWAHNPTGLVQLSEGGLEERPRSAQFLSIVSAGLKGPRADG